MKKFSGRRTWQKLQQVGQLTLNLVLMLALLPLAPLRSRLPEVHRQAGVPVIAYISPEGDVLLSDLEGTFVTQITRGGGYSDPAFAPDGQRLAYVRRVTRSDNHAASEVWVYDLNSEQESLLVPQEPTPFILVGSYYHFFDPRWSPDGEWLYFVTDDGRVSGFYPRKVHSRSGVTAPGFNSFYTRGLDVSRVDGSLVGKDFNNAGPVTGFGLHAYTADGRDQGVILPIQGGLDDFRLSPDGSRLAFFRQPPGSSLEFVTCDPQNCQPQAPSLPGFDPAAAEPAVFAWLPDGQGFLFSHNGRIERWTSAGREGVLGEGTQPAVSYAAAPAPQVQGLEGLLAYVDEDYNARIFSLADGESIPVSSGGGAGDPLFSPDGRYLAYLIYSREYGAGHTLWLFDLSSRESRPLIDQVGAYYDWAPDGQSLVFDHVATAAVDLCMGGSSPAYEGIWQVDVASGDVFELVPEPNDFPLVLPDWSYDGSVLSFVEQRYCEGMGTYGYWERDSGQIEIRRQEERRGRLDWAPDRLEMAYDGVVYADQPPNIQVGPYDAAPTRLLSAGGNLGHYFPRWSPAGDWIAFLAGGTDFTAPAPSFLYAAPLSGGETRRLSDVPASILYTWSPDGFRVAFTGADGAIYIVALDGTLNTTGLRGRVYDWYGASDVPVEPTVPAPAPVEVAELLANKQTLIEALSRLTFNFLDSFDDIEVPTLGYNESQAQTLLDRLRTAETAGTIIPEQLGSFERLLLYENGFYRLFRVDARAADNVSESVVGLVSVVAQVLQVLDLMRELVSGVPLVGDLLNRLISRVEQEFVDVLSGFIQYLIYNVPDAQVREELRSVVDVISVYIDMRLGGGDSLVDVLLGGVARLLGDFELLGAYVFRTQPALDQAAAFAAQDGNYSGSAELAYSEAEEDVGQLEEVMDSLDEVHSDLMASADIVQAVSAVADIATVLTAPTSVGPAIAQMVALVTRITASLQYTASAGMNAVMLYRAPERTYQLISTVFYPDIQTHLPEGPPLPGAAVGYQDSLAGWSAPLVSTGSLRAARVHQSAADLEAALARLQAALGEGDQAQLAAETEAFLDAAGLVSQDLNTEYTLVLQAGETTPENSAALFAARAELSLALADLYGSLTAALVEPDDAAVRTPGLESAAGVQQALDTYSGELTTRLERVDFETLPAAARLAGVILPQNVLVGEPFVLSVTLENAARQAAETVTVRVSAERGLEPAQVEQPVGVLAAGAQQPVEVHLALADTETWAWVEVLTAGQVTDLRLVRFAAQQAGSTVQAQEKTGPDWFLIGGGGLLLLAALLLLIWLVSRGRKNIKPVTPAGPAVFCAYCGSPLAPQARFCPNCGRERVE